MGLACLGSYPAGKRVPRVEQASVVLSSWDRGGGWGDWSYGADHLVFSEQCDFTEDQTAGRPSLSPAQGTLGRGTRPRAPSPHPPSLHPRGSSSWVPFFLLDLAFSFLTHSSSLPFHSRSEPQALGEL